MLEYLYQDDELIVCLKPVGQDSEQLAQQNNLYTVHRLDKQVSGVMVYAKTKATAAHLSAQMQRHDFCKIYHAVVEGSLTEPSGRWEDLLYHDKRKNKVFTVKKERKGVKQAALNYKLLATGQTPTAPAQSVLSQPTTSEPEAKSATEKQGNDTLACSLLEIKLETGRTHQIRVQSASRKLPLIGDNRYGSQIKGCNIALFSHEIGFFHPKTGAFLRFTHPVPSTYPWTLFSL